jgi:hypothetical protein
MVSASLTAWNVVSERLPFGKLPRPLRGDHARATLIAALTIAVFGFIFGNPGIRGES